MVVPLLSQFNNSDKLQVYLQQPDKNLANCCRDSNARPDKGAQYSPRQDGLHPSWSQSHRSFSYLSIRLQSDRLFPNHFKTKPVVTQYTRPEERLSILRSEDRFRPWESLDDKRCCVLCERTFNGRQVEIRGRSGRFTLHCPMEDCHSTPRHWVCPGNPLVSDQVYQDWSLALGIRKKHSRSPKGGAT